MARLLKNDLVKYCVFALAAWAATQAIGYWIHVDAVSKTLTSELMIYHARGEEDYRQAVISDLKAMGMKVRPSDFTTIEDRSGDEFRAEIRYEWPLKVLWLTFDRMNTAATRTTILDG